MSNLRCYKCGKFIADKDWKDCHQEDILSWDKMEIEDNKMRIYELRDKYKSEGKYE